MEKTGRGCGSPRGYSLAKSSKLLISGKVRLGTSKYKAGESSSHDGRRGAKKPRKAAVPPSQPALRSLFNSAEVVCNQARRRRLVLEEDSDDGVFSTDPPEQEITTRRRVPSPAADDRRKIQHGMHPSDGARDISRTPPTVGKGRVHELKGKGLLCIGVLQKNKQKGGTSTLTRLRNTQPSPLHQSLA
ncbi:unnamed protein product [Linum trigynum]|uniref:Uncharacterized protein n=1 Tax=Linum trigynum TaxID=586398 RepID=A0AAV2G7A3_9ROSI